MLKCALSEIGPIKSLIPYLTGTQSGLYTQVCLYRLVHRKPLWLPPSKKKLFHIPVRPVIPKEEVNELMRIHKIHKTRMRTIYGFLENERAEELLTLENALSQKSLEEEQMEFDRCVKENDLWNAECAKIRNQRLEADAITREQFVSAYKARKDEIFRKATEEAEEKIRKFKEDSKTFITVDTLDDAIAKSMNSLVDYNFAIDTEGTIYPGREGGPDSKYLEEISSNS